MISQRENVTIQEKIEQRENEHVAVLRERQEVISQRERIQERI